jgi:cold shock CspA family protein
MSDNTTAVTTTTGTSSSQRYLGRVKWFNTRAGYGFITVTDGSLAGSDVFVHHSSIKVDSEQYKYLVQGEYVEFSLLVTTGQEHEHHAGDVSGIKGGKLMCETRHELKVSRTQYRASYGQPEDEVSEPRSVRPPRRSGTDSGTRPRQQRRTGGSSDGQWSYVGSRRGEQQQQQRTSSTGRGRGRGFSRGGRGRGRGSQDDR